MMGVVRRYLLVSAIGIAVLAVACDYSDPIGTPQTATSSTFETVIPPTSLTPPSDLGQDPDLDFLAQLCFEGDFVSCDDLFVNSASGSAYEAYALTCAGRNPPQGNCVSLHAVFSTNRDPRMFEGDGLATSLVDVRTAGHETFDRFVLEFSGPGTPTYSVTLEDGAVAEVGGTAHLVVEVGPTSTELEEGLIVASIDTTNLRDSILAQANERILWILGLEEGTGFEVALLEEPTRLVIDISHNT
jgi:hypothetical protein